MTTQSLDSSRLYFIDWLRVLAFGLLILFHCAMPFVTVGWEIKNQDQSVMLTRVIWWLHQWRLPLLFFIAGVGTHYSLSRRSGIAFLGERFVRLFIPLAFAMMFTTPLQVYFEYLQEGKITMSYADFYPAVWDFIPYPDGALTWSHLWFVVYLFVFTLLLFPVFMVLRIKAVQHLKMKLDGAFKSPFFVFAFAGILIYYYFALYIKWPEQQNLIQDWFVFVFSMTLFFLGYLLANLPSFWDTCERYRFYFLGTAVVCIAWLFIQYWWTFEFPKQQDQRLYTYGILNATHIWMLILSAFGFARRHLNFTNPFLKYTTPAVYPFYIMHQTIIVVSGYYVVQWPLPWVLKLLILVVICFGGVLFLYHVVIKNFILTRILYGLKARSEKIIVKSEEITV